MNEIWCDSDNGAVVINDSGLPMNAVLDAVGGSREIAELVTWKREAVGGGTASHLGRRGTLIERDRYISPANPYDQMRIAYEAASSDDVVGSVLDSTEALAFGRAVIGCNDADEQDIWSQIAEDLDLDRVLRSIWRESFITSNCYVATWWGQKDYKVQGKNRGADGVARKRKKVFPGMQVPLGITTLDPLRVLPVGGFAFGMERLCYIADWSETSVIDSWLLGGDASGVDPVLQQLIVARYNPDLRERKEIGNLGVDPNRLFLFNPKLVYRQTPTRSDFERFATVRLKSVFEILDLKQQLRQMDRAHLIGATNFIVLVKKGSKDRPGTQPEVDALRSSMRSVAQVGVIVGDDRLNIEIITPKTDTTLNAEKYAGLDIRISGRLYGMFITTQSRGDDSIKLARVVARGLEDKRNSQRRNLMRYVLKPCYARNDMFTEVPKLDFFPQRVALDFDPALASYMLDLRDRGDLSRKSALAAVDHDEIEEAEAREMEAERFDHIFGPTQVPFSGSGGGAPQPGDIPLPAGPQPAGRAGGRQGGIHNGGGAAPGTGQGQASRRPGRAPGQSGTSNPRNAGRRAAANEIDAEETAEEMLDRIGQLPRRTRAHAQAVAALARRRRAETAALDDQADTLGARHAEQLRAVEARHAAEIAELTESHQAELDVIVDELTDPTGAQP